MQEVSEAMTLPPGYPSRWWHGLALALFGLACVVGFMWALSRGYIE